MKTSKKEIIIPPAPQKKTGKSGKRVQSADVKKKFSASGSQFENNNSYLSQSSRQSTGKKDKLNNSLEEKKKRLEKLTQLLKGEKVNLKEEFDSEEEEEFEFVMKETAMKEFQKQVFKQALVEDETQLQQDEFKHSTTIKKDQMSGILFADNLQDTVNARQERLGKENIQSNDEQQSGIVAKNPPPQRGGIKSALMNNFTDEAQPAEQQAAVPNQPKKSFQPKRHYTAKQKIFMAILIQSVVRMFLQRRKYLKEKQRLELLLKEHQTELRKKREEDEEEQLAIEQGKTPFAGRHTIHFTGIEKLLQDHQSQKVQISQRANKKRTHSEGPFSLYQQMKENEEEGIVEEGEEDKKLYKLYQTRFNPLRKTRPPLPQKVPLNNNFFNDRSIVDCFVKKNRTNVPLQLKKSSSSGDSYQLSTLPEYQELLKKSKLPIKQPQAQFKQTKQEEDSVIYSDTFEKESVEVSPNQKRYPFMKSTPQKRSSIHSGISEEDYLKESFDMDTPSQSIRESIRESFTKESNRFQSSFSMSGKIKEDIPEESIIGESINESSIVDEVDLKNRKKNASIQEEIQTSLEDEDYLNDKFESISEDLNNSEQKSVMRESISEDIAGMSFESRGKRGKKKSVTFSQERSAQIAKQLVAPQAAAAAPPPSNNQMNNNSGILRRSTEQLSVDQMVSISQKSKDSTLKFKDQQTNQASMQAIHEMYFGKEGLSDAWRKFENIRNQYDEEGHSKELTKEQQELGKLQKDIYQMLSNTKNLADKWQEERDSLLTSDKNASQKAEQVYQKFQSEFNRILQSTPMLNRFSLLKNYLEYRDRQMKNINLFTQNSKPPMAEDTAAAIQKEVQSQVEGMVKNLEQKQEIMYKVLQQVVENLQNMGQTSLEFEDMRRIRDFNNSKLDDLLANQEKILKFQFEQEMVFREDQLKLLYSGKPITEEELNRIRIRQLLSQNRKEQIIPMLQPDRANFIPQILIKPGQYETGQIIQVDNNIKKDISLSSSIDMEAMSDSRISWQSGQDMWDNLTERDREKINDFNTEQVVDFLSEILLQEIQQDLFPMRMTTSHLQLKKNDRLIQDRAIEKISPPKFNQQISGEKKGGIQSTLQDSMSPHNRPGTNSAGKLKSDRTLTEESKYESDFEDSEDKFGQSLQSNRSNNKSYNFEENDTSGGKTKQFNKESDKYGQKKNSDALEERTEEEEEDLEYEQDFEDSVEKQPTQVTKTNTSNSLPTKSDKSIKPKEDFDDPMGLTGKAFDRNSLLAEIEENDKTSPANNVQKTSSLSKNKQKQPDDEDYKGDNDFFKPQVENESGNIEKNLNKELYKNQLYYDKTSRTLNQLKSILKKKKKMKIIKDVLETIASNNYKGKKMDSFLGTILKNESMQIFENSDCKNNEERVVAAALQENLYNNIIKNIQDLEQFHFEQAFNRKEIQAEIVLRWDHICDVAAQQTLQIVEKVVPVDYHSDVKIDKTTPFKKVKRFCTINTVAKEDNELFELQNYDLYKEQVLVQTELSDQVLQNIVNQLARDIISIQNKQANKV